MKLASDVPMQPLTEASAERQGIGPPTPSPFRVWGRVLRAFDSILIRPLKTRVRLEPYVPRYDDRDLSHIVIKSFGYRRNPRRHF